MSNLFFSQVNSGRRRSMTGHLGGSLISEGGGLTHAPILIGLQHTIMAEPSFEEQTQHAESQVSACRLVEHYRNTTKISPPATREFKLSLAILAVLRIGYTCIIRNHKSMSD